MKQKLVRSMKLNCRRPAPIQFRTKFNGPLIDDPWIERGGGFRAIAYSGPGSSIDVHSHDLAADQTMMRVYGHVDDDELPVAALKAALFHDRSSLIRISNFD